MDGVIRLIADSGTPFLDTPNFFSSVRAPSLDGEDVVFQAGTSSTSGIYASVDGVIRTVVDTNTPFPGSSDTFSGFSNPSFDDGKVAFRGAESSTTPPGIFVRAEDNPLIVVADANTDMPGGAGKFANLSDPVLDGDTVAFFGSDGLGDGGIFVYDGGPLTRLLDTPTPISDGGTLTGLSIRSLNNGNVAVRGGDASENNRIYLYRDGELKKVIDDSDRLDGRPLSSVSMVREALSGDFLAFNARFDDNNTGGLYVASPPELLDGIGQTYVQNFDAALGSDASTTGTILPTD